jgi:hypothetical protein
MASGARVEKDSGHALKVEDEPSIQVFPGSRGDVPVQRGCQSSARKPHRGHVEPSVITPQGI